MSNFDDKIKELYEIIKKHGKPSSNNDILFNDGTRVYDFIIRNKERILSRSDDYSLYIRDVMNWNVKKLSFGEKVLELYDIILENGRIKKSDNYLFSDGSLVFRFLTYYKKDLKKLYDKNEKVKYILDRQRALTFDDKLSEAYMIFMKEEKVVRSKDLRFSDGTLVYQWLRNNWETIKNVNDYRSSAIYLRVNWEINADEIFNLKLLEITEFLRSGILLTSKNDCKFSLDGSSLFNWFRYKKYDIYALKDTNPMCGLIVYQIELIKPSYFNKMKEEINNSDTSEIKKKYRKK